MTDLEQGELEPQRREASRIAMFVAAGVLALHLVAGIAALVLLPRGFAPDDIHLWSNTIIPVSSSLAVAVTLVSVVWWRRAAALVSILVAAAAGGWISAVILGASIFPISITLARSVVPALVAIALLGLAWWSRERAARSAVALVAGAGLGVVEILAQRAPPPSTHPLGGTLPDVHGAPSTRDADVDQMLVPCGTNWLRVNPVLTFVSRSPDRTWTILSPDPPGSHRRLSQYDKTTEGFQAAFIDDGHSTLVVHDDIGVEIDAMSKLDTPVYSHLNAFTTIEVPFDATLSFGPTGTRRFPIEPADYPSGRPTQLAYLDSDFAFHVVRASDAEKGPFSELAAGSLRRGEPLILEVRPRDDHDKGCRLIFQDWSSQVSTDPSPTAGWGVPQGSIQFFSRGAGLVVLTLAETGPGRGFDSVGHAAGTYRNRVRIEPIQ